jgi:hypothetical protein
MSARETQLIEKFAPYRWLIDKGLVGYEPFTALQPWYFLPEGELFFVTDRWPDGASAVPLLAFARRQDCDDIACLKESSGNALEVVNIQGWTSCGYEIIKAYPTFWEWFKSVIDDIAQWSALPEV